jgi:uncharacterized protein (DUF433 family)
MDAKAIIEESQDLLAPKFDVYEQAIYLYLLRHSRLGRPCIRGMRIRATDVLAPLSVSLQAEQVLQELPDLEEDDLRACLVYAAQALGGQA